MHRVVNVAIVITGLVFVALASVLVRRAWPAAEPEAPVVAKPPERCGAPSSAPLTPELSAATLHVVTGSVPFLVDGEAPPKRLTAGLHVLQLDTLRLQVRVNAFTPVLIDARSIDAVPFVLALGATCVACARSEGTLDLAWPGGGAPGSPVLAANALARTDWRAAMEELRQVAPTERDDDGFVRLAAATAWQAGQSDEARRWIHRRPKNSLLRHALHQVEDEESHLSERQLASAPARWNALTERYQRVSDAFPQEPEATSLSGAFDGLSRRITDALTRRDSVEVELSLADGMEQLERAIDQLRRRNSDCAWQERLARAL